MSRNGATTSKVRNMFYHNGLRSDANRPPTGDVSCGVHRHGRGDGRGRNEVSLSGVERAIPAGLQQRASATPSPLVADTCHQGVHLT